VHPASYFLEKMNFWDRVNYIFVVRVFLWWTAAFVDLSLIFKRGYEGTGTPQQIQQIAVTCYIILGVIAGLITFIVLYSRRCLKDKRYRPMAGLSWDIGFLVLMLAGFRINDIYLPGIGDLTSILWNIAILAGSVVVAFAARITLIRLRPSLVFTLVFLIWTGFLMYFGISRPGALPTETASGPNIILVTLDTVRADHLGAYGYERDTSPNFDRFASDNYLFTNCRTPMPLTQPAHASIFTGLMPHEHGIFTNIGVLSDGPGFRTITDRLTGYRSAAFPAALHLNKQSNMNRGFEVYNQSTVRRGPLWIQRAYQVTPIAIITRLGVFEETYMARTSAEVNSAFFDWIDTNGYGTGSKPFYTWLHYFDAHAPYNLEDTYWREYLPGYAGSITGSQSELNIINQQMLETDFGRTLPEGFTQNDIDCLIARYDGEIRLQDDSLGALFDGLRERDMYDDTVIVIVSDHGEGMYNDGYFGHNFTVEEYEIHVSCAIRGPYINCDSDEYLSLTDIHDYILEVGGVTPERQGRLTGREPDNLDPYTGMVFLSSHTWMDWPYKLVRTWEIEEAGTGVYYSLYNLEDDSSESVNLFEAGEEPGETMKSELLEWLEVNKADFDELIKKESTIDTINPSQLEMLRSLGYIY